jgi:hypothetical protein
VLPRNLDLFIAFGLLLIVIIVYAGSRIGILPKKSVGAVSAAVFGGMVFMWFGWWRRQHADAQVKALKDRIAEREKRITALMQEREIKGEELAAARAALDAQKSAVEREQQRLRGELAGTLDEIAREAPDKAMDRFDRLLLEEAEYQKRRAAAGGIR